jgi:peptidoglycan/LPS O-acetylase OafA/YrhL
LAHCESLALPQAIQLIWQRYLRLAIPLLAALSFTVLVTEWLRPDFDHTSLSAPPDWGQALAHVLLLQHWLDLEALSAGIWYVAIDLQLYAMALGCLVVLKSWPASEGSVQPSVQSLDARAWGDTRRWGLWLGLVCASLWGWNRDADLDDLGVYFWGSYGLGLLAWETRRQVFGAQGLLLNRLWAPAVLWVLVGGVAWWLEPRPRIAVAWGVAVLLVWVPDAWFKGDAVGRSRWGLALKWLSGVSYSVFLIHFGVCLAVNALVAAHWPAALWANALGMLLALLLSLIMGAGLHRLVERDPPTAWRWWFWVGTFKASVALALLMNPMV